MLETIVDRDAFVRVHGEHAVDEIQCWVTNTVPVRRGIVEAAPKDLLRECVGVVYGVVEFVGERREAAETDVEDDTKRPYVDGASVSAVVR